MKDGFIKAAAITPEIRVADCGSNAEEIIKACRKAADDGVKLAVFPELCITGCTCGDLFGLRTLLNGAKNAVLKIADAAAALNMIAVVGAPLEIGGRIYNCAVVVGKKILGIVPKANITDCGGMGETRCFADGGDIDGVGIIEEFDCPFGTELIFTHDSISEFSFGITFGDELFSPFPMSDALAVQGADIICCLSSSCETAGIAEARRIHVSAQSARIVGGYIYACAGSGESTTDAVYSAHNIIAEKGRIIAESKPFDNGCAMTEIDTLRLADERRKNKKYSSAEYNAYNISFELPVSQTKLTRHISRTPFIPEDSEKRDRRCAEILLMQSCGLKKRIEHTSAKNAVIGISGGLDSCLALLVAVKAMDLLGRPRTDVIAVTMPCFGTTSRTRSNAEKLCEGFGVTLRTVDITASVKQHFDDIGHDMENHNVVFENAQARERTQVIMDIANECGGLVIGTGDLSEVALGWSTYNGDHMSMYGVNASVPKTLIRHIIGYYSRETENSILSEVLDDILDTPVSPELLPSEDDKIVQKTEDVVGPYELHDFFIYYAVRFGCTPKKLLRMACYAFDGVYTEEIVKKWLTLFYRRFFSQQFKRSCSPDGAKIGSVSLSPRTDWHMPSDACVKLWLDELE